MRFLGSIRWIALALAGLAVAAGVSLAASQLVSERIGLAAEQVSAGKELAPNHQDRHATTGDARHAKRKTDAPPTRTTTKPSPTTTTAAPPTYSGSSTTAPPTTSPAPNPPSTGSEGGHEGADD